MQRDIFKLCADSLRTFTKKNYDIKLKAAHAHELVATYFGYKSKNTMLADKKYPLSNLGQAEIIVMIPDDVIDQRRNNLQGLSSELPDSYALGEAVYAPLFSDEWWTSQYPPFRGFDKLAKILVENSDAYQHTFQFYHDIPMQHVVVVKRSDNDVILSVLHSYQASNKERLVGGKTTIKLPRVAGRIGYGRPKLNVELWSGGMKRTLESLGVQP